MGRKLGLFRAIYLVSASCMGSFAFAFDTGVISAFPPVYYINYIDIAN